MKAARSSIGILCFFLFGVIKGIGPFLHIVNRKIGILCIILRGEVGKNRAIVA
jgi:hypothetical protein